MIQRSMSPISAFLLVLIAPSGPVLASAAGSAAPDSPWLQARPESALTVTAPPWQVQPEGIRPGSDPIDRPPPAQFPFQEGWPQVLPSGSLLANGIAMEDLDGDGFREVIAGTTRYRVAAWNHRGEMLPGWPVLLAGNVHSKAAVADLDGDGIREVIVPVRIGVAGAINVYRMDGSPLPGWPRGVPRMDGFISPSIVDLDLDGYPEVVFPARETLCVWDRFGEPVPGFPLVLPGPMFSTAAVGNVTGDPRPEIVVVASEADHPEVFVIRADGSVAPGWPAAVGGSHAYAAPVIADLDANGFQDVLVGSSLASGETVGRVYGFDALGRTLAGFPLVHDGLQAYATPVVGDLNRDGRLEIILPVKRPGPVSSLWGWDERGGVLRGWPVSAQANLEGSALIANLDDDAELEAIVADNYTPGRVYASNYDGAAPDGFPFFKLGPCGPTSGSVADIDGDGDLEYGLNMDGVVSIYDLAAPDIPGDWPVTFHDAWNTNCFGFVIPGETSGAMAAGGGGTVPRRWIHSARFATPNRIELVVETDARVARVSLHDALGRETANLRAPRDRFLPGRHTWVLERDPLPSGIYFLVPTGADGPAGAGRAGPPQRLVLVK